MPAEAIAGAGRVCAIVVSFNRKDLLRECLRALDRQERKPDQIVVVDNASTDGTALVVKEEFPHAELVELPGNFGGAGGFHAGVRWGYTRGFDWLWLMDDDVRALPHALGLLLDHAHLGDFLHCRRREADGQPYRWDFLWDYFGAGTVPIKEDNSSSSLDWTCLRYGNFEGALIHRRVPDRIGYPDARYFISGDDMIYGLLASLHTRVIMINQVGFERALRGQSISKLGFYTAMRNRFLLRQSLEKVSKFRSGFLFWAHVLRALPNQCRNVFSPVSSGPSGQNMMAVLRGLWDGARGRFGPPPWVETRLEDLERFCAAKVDWPGEGGEGPIRKP